MLRAEDFKCAEHGMFEVFDNVRKEARPCPTCGAESPRVLTVGLVSPKFVYFKNDTIRRNHKWV